ncbi:P-loop containing nucleoside triphosphate hydrolase protein [Rutstroemia sp. NJR-2017a WRK4]|nr:P-loop containing nucleoside triphosphate hydrolase protein [Rutstroemia sp. NJR-2017a WRK4]
MLLVVSKGGVELNCSWGKKHPNILNLFTNQGLLFEPSASMQYLSLCSLNPIVAVHGLGGGAASTWRHKQTHFLWLRDCLPAILEDIPRGTTVRIWTFGYNANTVFSTAVAGISEFTQSLLSFIDEAEIGQDVGIKPSLTNAHLDKGRKVIFVAHSLGGVVVKSALIDAARRGSQHSWLLNATIGIVFLATPHQGSKIANKGSFVANIAKYTGIVRPNGETLRSLKRNSGELFDKAEQFRTICGGMKICSFYETLTMGSFGLVRL